MTNYKLEIKDKSDNSIEVFLNTDCQLYIGEINANTPAPFFITLSRDDWKELKKYADRLFKELDNEKPY